MAANKKEQKQDVIANICAEQTKSDIPEFKAGDTVKVHTKIVEGAKERVQVFQGIVIKFKKGTSATATFTVRKISYNVGVEKTFMLHSPRIVQIEVINFGSVRRSRLFFLRERSGKAARVKTKLNYLTKKEKPAKDQVPTAESSAEPVAEKQAAPAKESAIKKSAAKDSPATESAPAS